MLALATWAVVSGPSGKTAVLVNSMPLWIPLFAWPLLGERIGARWAAIVLGVVGLALMIDPRDGTNWLSDASGVAAAVCWAAAAVVTKQAQRSAAFDPLSFTAWQVLAGSIPLTLIALAVHHGPVILSTPAILAVAYNGVLATGLAFVLFAYAIKQLPASIAGAGSLSIPIIGVAAAWVQLGERPTDLEWAGTICVVGALVLMARPLHLARTGIDSHEPLPHERPVFAGIHPSRSRTSRTISMKLDKTVVCGPARTAMDSTGNNGVVSAIARTPGTGWR